MNNMNTDRQYDLAEMDFEPGEASNEFITSDALTLRELLDEPVLLEEYPWAANKYSPTPLGWRDIAGKGYYMPALRYMHSQIDAIAAKKTGVDNVVAAAKEECNHAHAQVCDYSQTSMDALRNSELIDQPLTDVDAAMIQAARSGAIDLTNAALLVAAYPVVGSLEGGKETVGCARRGFTGFDKYVDDGLQKLKTLIEESKAPLQLEILAPEDREVHIKHSHREVGSGEYVCKHPFVKLEKILYARLTGSLDADGEPIELELVIKKSTVSENHAYLLGEDMSEAIVGSCYWRDAHRKKHAATQ